MTYHQQPVSPPAIDRKREHRRALVIGAVTVAAVVLVFAALWVAAPGSKADTFTVEVTSCEASTSTRIAAVGFTITNTSDRVSSAQVRVEYRDGAGARLDTDTAYVADVRPGDTVRSQETTALDALPPGGSLRCAITGIS